MAGRKPKLTPELQHQLCELLGGGALVKLACQSVGIPVGTFFRWMQEGEAEKAPAVKREFREAITQARATGQLSMISQIQAAAQDRGNRRGDWRALAWLLERMNPELFHLVDRREISGPAGAPVPVAATAAAGAMENPFRIEVIIEPPKQHAEPHTSPPPPAREGTNDRRN